MQIVLIFATTHHALAAESVLLEQRVWHELLPPPRELTLSCGLCLAVCGKDFARIEKLLADAQIPISGAYRMPDRAGDPYLPLG
ncbi:MAG: hypothetical protein DDT37_01490 [Firmicutes bacterium]|nr:hypothetical protein [candidate division NPL-UPA2 bacterium]MBT9156504.1 hypothetical protein [candidate division NPL-UPA2 bacterium]